MHVCMHLYGCTCMFLLTYVSSFLKLQACKGLSTIYSSKVTAVPSNEISRLLSIRSKSSAISKDMWARVKSGKYKGDLAKVRYFAYLLVTFSWFISRYLLNVVLSVLK